MIATILIKTNVLRYLKYYLPSQQALKDLYLVIHYTLFSNEFYDVIFKASKIIYPYKMNKLRSNCEA